jgi:hypothetical protein
MRPNPSLEPIVHGMGPRGGEMVRIASRPHAPAGRWARPLASHRSSAWPVNRVLLNCEAVTFRTKVEHRTGRGVHLE